MNNVKKFVETITNYNVKEFVKTITNYTYVF